MVECRGAGHKGVVLDMGGDVAELSGSFGSCGKSRIEEGNGRREDGGWEEGRIIIEWLGLEGTPKIVKFQLSCHRHGHQPLEDNGG